jgi:hypothetical protein
MGGQRNRDAEWFNRPRGYVQRPSRQWLRPSWWWLAGVGGFLLAGLIAFEFAPPLFGCHVKGNISRNTGERIDHVPDQKYYSQTRLDFFKGEQWFCSEAAAVAAGWRKAKI